MELVFFLIEFPLFGSCLSDNAKSTRQRCTNKHLFNYGASIHIMTSYDVRYHPIHI